MEAILIKVLAFIVAIGILVTIHEFGHFWVARRLGVRVQKFSIGFGRPLWRRRGRDGTEYIIAAIPLGGYVKMLGEGDDEPLTEAQKHEAFNHKSLSARSAIAAAGPLFNFFFAIFAFWLVLVIGESGLRPWVGTVTPDSVAAQAGFQPGEEIVAVNGEETPTWSMVMYQLASASVSDQPTRINVREPDGLIIERVLPADSIREPAEQPDLLGGIGLKPEEVDLPAVVGEVLPGEPAEAAGLRPGDRLLAVDGQPLRSWSDWVDYIRAHPDTRMQVEVERAGDYLTLVLVSASLQVEDKVIGRIGAAPQPPPEELRDHYIAEYRLDPLSAVPAAVGRTWDFSVLTLKVIGQVLIGQASVKNLSGPITIADVAGKTASAGITQFLKFLALVSVSLGVLNLLPVPVLDGGHLLFNALEAVKGSPLSDAFVMQAQRVGMALLMGLIGLALYVDISRLLA